MHSPSCIDLIITNRPKSFQNSVVIETCLSDFHKMSLTVSKIFYKNQRPNIVRYRNYRNFDNERFMNDVEKNQFLEFETFKKKVDCIFEKHAFLKKRYVRANQAPVIDKFINNRRLRKEAVLVISFFIAKATLIQKPIMHNGTYETVFLVTVIHMMLLTKFFGKQ